jgi:hypothetical protein
MVEWIAESSKLKAERKVDWWIGRLVEWWNR